MADGDALKSAFELAMERLQKKDAESGVVRKAVTEEQKAAIAEVRSLYEARIAELEVMHQSQLRGVADPLERDARDEEHRRERERLTAERDAKIEAIRQPSQTE